MNEFPGFFESGKSTCHVECRVGCEGKKMCNKKSRISNWTDSSATTKKKSIFFPSIMSFGTLKYLNHHLLSTKIRTKPVQTLAGIRYRIPQLLKDPKFEPLCWLGVHGLFSRNQQTRTSEIDMTIGLRSDFDTGWDEYLIFDRFETRASKVFGRKVHLMPVLSRDIICGYGTLKAVLTCVTVYGPEDWHDCARTQARAMLDEGYVRLRKAYQISCQIEQVLRLTNKNVK
jgi:predicted nucleotidyltransferase